MLDPMHGFIGCGGRVKGDAELERRKILEREHQQELAAIAEQKRLARIMEDNKRKIDEEQQQKREEQARWGRSPVGSGSGLGLR